MVVETIYSELFFCRRSPPRLYKVGTKCKLHYRQVIYLWKNTYLFNAPSPRQPSLRLSHLRQCSMHLTMNATAKREFESFELHEKLIFRVDYRINVLYIDMRNWLSGLLKTKWLIPIEKISISINAIEIFRSFMKKVWCVDKTANLRWIVDALHKPQIELLECSIYKIHTTKTCELPHVVV